MKIVLVTRDSVFGRYLAASLHAAGKIDRLIIETGRPTWRFYWGKLRRVGLVNGLFQVLLNVWFQREGARHLAILPLPPHHRVTNINGFAFGDEDLVIGFGTSLITAGTLAALKHGFLNLHTGSLPDYRGVKAEYWTLAHGNDAAAWTLHYMTPRLDDGDIVLQRAVPVVGENPAELRAKLLRDAVPALGEFIERVRQGGLAAISRRPQRGGRYFTTPTWREWRDYRRRCRANDGGTMSRRMGWAIQIVVATIVVGMVWRVLSRNWDAFRSLHVVLRPSWTALSTLTVLAAYSMQIESWRRILAGWAQHPSFGRAARIWLLGNLGRYVPGKLGSVAGLVVLAQRAGVATWAGGASAFAIQAVALGTGVLVVAAAIPVAESPLRLAAAAVVAFATIALLSWGRGARWLARRVAGFRPLPLAAVAASAGMMLASWVAYGVAFWLLAPGVGLEGALPLHTAEGVFALGYLLGVITFVAPAGVGVRELAFIGLLTPTLGSVSAVALTVASRLLMTVCEVAALIGVLMMTGRSNEEESCPSRGGRIAATAGEP
jgi:hypothetical protein